MLHSCDNMNFFITTLLVTIIVQCSWANPTVKGAESKAITTKTDAKPIKDSKIVEEQRTPLVYKEQAPDQAPTIPKNAASLSTPVEQAIELKLHNNEIKPRFDYHIRSLGVRSEENHRSLERYRHIAVPESLSSVEWNCVVQVIKNLVSCLRLSNPKSEGYVKAHTGEDLYKNSGRTISCILEVSVEMTSCVHLTDASDSDESDYTASSQSEEENYFYSPLRK